MRIQTIEINAQTNRKYEMSVTYVGGERLESRGLDRHDVYKTIAAFRAAGNL